MQPVEGEPGAEVLADRRWISTAMVVVDLDVVVSPLLASRRPRPRTSATGLKTAA
jgi:hypothetical protein